MEWVGAICALIAGGVLVFSGTLKLGRHTALLTAMDQLEVPAALRTERIAQAVPVAEIALGLGVLALPPPAFTIEAAGATILYAVFLALVISAVRNKRVVSCDCFGSLSAKPVSSRTVIRNGLLCAVSSVGAFVATSPAEHLAQKYGGGLWAVPAIVCMAAAIGLRLFEARAQRRAQAKLIADLQLFDRAGSPIPLAEFQDPATVLVFMSATCGACQEVVEHLRWWPNALPEGLDVQPVFTGKPENFEPYEAFAPLIDYAWYDPEYTVARAVAPGFTPAAVVIDRAHPLGRDLVSGLTNIQHLVVRPGFWDEPAQRELMAERESNAEQPARQDRPD